MLNCGRLVLSRKVGETITIQGVGTIVVSKVSGATVKLELLVDRERKILRGEPLPRKAC